MQKYVSKNLRYLLHDLKNSEDSEMTSESSEIEVVGVHQPSKDDAF